MKMQNVYSTLKFEPSSTVMVTTVADPALTATGLTEGFAVLPVAGLPGLVTSAESQGKSVRVAGSLWSSTDVMATLDTSVTLVAEGETALARFLGCSQAGAPIISFAVGPSAILPGALTASVVASGARLVHIDAGMKIHRLLEFLASSFINLSPLLPIKGPWCLPNMGASSGQRVIGAVSTATHGGAFERSPLADSVRALRVIGPGGVDVWLEREGSRALTTVDTLPGLPTTTVLRSDELFLATLVSVGAMGVVTELVIEAQPEVGMSQQCKTRPWSKVRAALESGKIFDLSEDGVEDKHPEVVEGGDISVAPEGLEILINPYRLSDNYGPEGDDERNCRVIYRALRLGAPADDETLSQTLASAQQFVSLVLAAPAIGDLLANVGVTTISLFAMFELGALPVYREIIEVLHQVLRSDTDGFAPVHKVLDTFDGNGWIPPGMSFEIAIPTTDGRHLALLDEMLAEFDALVAEGKRFAGFFSVRITRPSAATLAMQQSWEAVLNQDTGPQICHIEVLTLNDISLDLDGVIDFGGDLESSSEHFVRAFVACAERHGARLHWGQTHFLDRQRVIADYPLTLHSWRRARTRLCSQAPTASWRTFSNAHSRRTGLESYHEAVAALVNSGSTEAFTLTGENEVTIHAGGAEPDVFNTTSIPVCTPVAAVNVRTLNPTGGGGGTTSPDVQRVVFSQAVDGRMAWVTAQQKGVLSLKSSMLSCTGPWSAVDDGAEVHLLAVDGGGMRWARAMHLFGIWTAIHVTPGVGLLAHTLSACVDSAGTTHVVGLSDQRVLLHGTHTQNAGGWTFQSLPVALQPVPGLGVPVVPLLTGPVAVTSTAPGVVHIFGVGRDGQLFHIWGSVVTVVPFAWEEVPVFVPGPPMLEIEARDLGGDDAYQVFPHEWRLTPRPVGPLAVVTRDGWIDVTGRTDRGSLFRLSRAPSGTWDAIASPIP
ncbi:hypothetical protein [Nannocystis radixulma]|uniref:FAD-binding PCMH-type domain-containing protein n=1 Tax=Nannocystis radixulma TaxID=2995305 RepID=A0ABT5AZ20_9BACT|nr:hypothetical protein [Nannocystis radixulma]MDC0666187.1 hypothetical protein [Nannocystis radixulma]